MVARPGTEGEARYDPDVVGAIAALRSAPVEIGFGFDADGRQSFRQVGDSDEIR
jgi:hypothetical protein